MDELVLSGKKYISSKRAAELTGYAKDYIGQLARAGKVSATRFGRAWYVEESSILAHLNADQKEITAKTRGSTPLSEPIRLPQSFYKPYQFPNSWSSVQYISDDSDLFPALTKTTEVSILSEPINTAQNVVSPASSIKIEKTPISVSKFYGKSLHPKSSTVSVDGMLAYTTRSTVSPFKPTPYVAKKSGQRIPMTSLVALGGVVMLIISYTSLFFSFKGGIPAVYSSGAYTASALTALQSAFAAFLNSPFIQEGLSGALSFVHLILGSFWIFVTKAITFIQGLI